MSIPHVKAISPDAGVKRTSTGSFNGKARRIFSVGNTTSVPQDDSTVRRTVIFAGTPALIVSSAGWKSPAVTVT